MNAVRGRRQRGFSLIELGVSLIVMGILGLLLWRWILAAQEPATEQKIQQQLSEAQAAVEGFVLANHRLPCPALAATGTETCTNAAAVSLPWRTLGVSSAMGELHYGANRGGGVDLAVLPTATIAPDLNIDLTGVPLSTPPTSNTAATAAITAATEVGTLITTARTRRAQVNGLDWCRVLRTYAANPALAGALQAGNATNSLPVAYILVHPGQNRQFDGNNALGVGGSFRYDLPGREQDAQYDDIARAVGPSDLSARLGCVTRMSAAMAAAQAAFAQYDTTRVMQEYWSLRAYDVVTAESNVISAGSGVAAAALGLILATADSILAIASALNTEGLTAFLVAVTIANLVVAVANQVLAAKALEAAITALADAKTKLDATSVYAAETYQLMARSLRQSILLDEKGLNP